MKVDVLVPAGAEDGVLVDGDDAQIVGVLPQYLQLRHVGLVQPALSVFHLSRTEQSEIELLEDNYLGFSSSVSVNTLDCQ